MKNNSLFHVMKSHSHVSMKSQSIKPDELMERLCAPYMSSSCQWWSCQTSLSFFFCVCGVFTTLLLCLSAGWATGVPWSSGLASGSSVTAAEEPTATPTCSSASEAPTVFLSHGRSRRTEHPPQTHHKPRLSRLWHHRVNHLNPPESEHGFYILYRGM